MGGPSFWGLVTNLTGLAALLYVLPSLDRLAEKPTGKNVAWATLGMPLLYFAHEAMMLCGCIAVALLTLCHPLRVRDTLLRVTPAIFASATFVTQNRWQAGMMSETVKSVPTTFMPLLHKIGTLPSALLGGHEPLLQYLLFGMVVLTMLVFFLARRKACPPRQTRLRELHVVDDGDTINAQPVRLHPH